MSLSPDARDLLSKISARHGARTRPSNLLVRGTPESFDRRSTFTVDGIRADAFANTSQLYVQIRCGSRVLFSTPGPDATMNLRHLLGHVAGHDVHVSDRGIGSPIPWIYSSAAVDALQSLGLGDTEQLAATIGGLSAILDARDDSTVHRVDDLVAFARRLPDTVAQQTSIDPQRLPVDLRALIPLVTAWGLTDDDERSDRVENADRAPLRALVEQGHPHLNRIAEFLDAPGLPPDAVEVGALDAFAQAVMEAEHELRRRQKE